MIARALTTTDLADVKALRLEGIRLFPTAFLLTEAEALAASDDAMLAWINAGRGVSRRLLDRIAREAMTMNVRQLELDVGAANAPAIKVCAAAGYTITGTIANCLNHDGHFHDQYLMIRPLTA